MSKYKNPYENPEYWCGEIGYRPPGYSDFPINRVKEACIILENPLSVLDIGCAFGYSVARLRSLGVYAWGIDISNYALSKASEEIQPYLKRAQASRLPFQDKEFDFIFSSGVLEHLSLKELKQAIKEITRVGRRGLIGVSCTDDPTTYEGDDDTHQVILSKAAWQDLFPDAFRVVSDSEEEWVKLLNKRLAPINALIEGYMAAGGKINELG